MKEIHINKCSERFFAIKIATLNAIVFLGIAVGDTYVFPLLKTQITFGSQHHPLGYWVGLFAIPIFLSSYYLILKPADYWVKTIAPFMAAIIISWTISVLNFGPPTPPLGQMMGFLQFGWGVLAASIHFSDSEKMVLNSKEVNSNFKQEWLKGQMDFWRTMAFSAALGFFSIVFMAFDQTQNWVARQVSDKAEQAFLHNYIWMQYNFWGLYIILGPLYEIFSKAKNLGVRSFEIAMQSEKKDGTR